MEPDAYYLYSYKSRCFLCSCSKLCVSKTKNKIQIQITTRRTSSPICMYGKIGRCPNLAIATISETLRLIRNMRWRHCVIVIAMLKYFVNKKKTENGN